MKVFFFPFFLHFFPVFFFYFLFLFSPSFFSFCFPSFFLLFLLIFILFLLFLFLFFLFLFFISFAFFLFCFFISFSLLFFLSHSVLSFFPNLSPLSFSFIVPLASFLRHFSPNSKWSLVNFKAPMERTIASRTPSAPAFSMVPHPCFSSVSVHKCANRATEISEFTSVHSLGAWLDRQKTIS